MCYCTMYFQNQIVLNLLNTLNLISGKNLIGYQTAKPALVQAGILYCPQLCCNRCSCSAIQKSNGSRSLSVRFMCTYRIFQGHFLSAYRTFQDHLKAFELAIAKCMILISICSICACVPL